MQKKKQPHKFWNLAPLPVLLLVLVILYSQFAFSAKTLEVTEGELVSLKVNAFDENSDPLTYSFSPPLDKSGQWQTKLGDAGEYDIEVTVSDGKSETAQYVHLVVKKANRPPVLQSFEDIAVNEGDTVKIVPKAVDEEGDELKYSVSEPIGDDFTWQTGYGDEGEYLITVTVSDRIHTVSKSFKLTVNNLNRDPLISSFSPKEQKIEIPEGNSVEFRVSASDPDNDDLSCTWYLDNKKVSDSWEYTYASDYSSAGTHTLVVDVSDKEATLQREWTVLVANTNRAPELNDIPDITAKEGDIVKLELDAYDPDSDELYYKAGEPLGNDLEWQTDYSSAGKYANKIEITDGQAVVAKIVNIIIQNVNRAPLFKKIQDIYLNEGERAAVDLKAEDPDGDMVFFSAGKLPDGAYVSRNSLIFEPGYGTVYKNAKWYNRIIRYLRIDRFVYPKTKKFDINIAASDNETSTSQVFSFIVSDVNRKPVLGDLPAIIINETDSITLKLSGTDPDNDRIRFYFSSPLDKNGRWKTTYNDAGEYTAFITVSDNKLEDTKPIKIIVQNKNRIPVFAELSHFDAKENQTVAITPSISDPDGDKIELSLAEAPKGAKITNGTFTWTPGFDFVPENGSISVPVSFVAFDGKDYVKYSALITVRDNNRLPVLINATPAKKTVTAYVNEPVYFSSIASDYDKDELSYRWKFGVMDWVQGAPVLKRTFTEPGNKEVKLIVSDGKDSITKEWIVNVLERSVSEPAKKTGAKIRYVIDNKNAQTAEMQAGKKVYIVDNPKASVADAAVAGADAENVQINIAPADKGMTGDAVTFAID